MGNKTQNSGSRELVFVVYTGRSSDGNATCRLGGGKYLARSAAAATDTATTPSAHAPQWLPPGARARTRDNCEREPETNTTDSGTPRSYSTVSTARLVSVVMSFGRRVFCA